MDNNSNNNNNFVFSGIKPSGDLTLGNYLGAIKNWVKYQHENKTFFCIVDMHAITVRQDPELLRRRSLEMMAIYIAAGLDPKKNTLFIQSHVPAHAELAWVLGCYTQFGELSRMTQFKDYVEKKKGEINAGLFMYPVLMAADILLYNAKYVPVGVDQKQHVELARNIAERFNFNYGETFVIPEPSIERESAKIYSLQDPTKKMSKSESANANAYILLLEEKDAVIKKFKKAVTDSDGEIRFAEGKDGVNNLISIYSCVTGKSVADIEKEFAGSGYGTFKTAVGEAVYAELEPLQAKYNELMGDLPNLESILRDGRDRAAETANETLKRVYGKVGFYSL